VAVSTQPSPTQPNAAAILTKKSFRLNIVVGLYSLKPGFLGILALSCEFSVNMNRTKITVLGAGSWGIALANHYQRLGHQVTIWGNELAVLEEVAKTGVCQRYFPGTVGLSGIISETDLLAALESASLVVVALPSSAIRQVLTGVRLASDSVIVSASKGLEPGTHLRMSQVIEQSLLSENAVVVLTGPSFAFEVLTGMPTAVTVASKCPEAAQQVQSLTHAERFRVYLTDDLVGVELACRETTTLT
jgi:glycerol-3-phosphate dehydrogenase (NAD(P)+)